MATFTAGYAIVWLSLVAYVGWLSHRQHRLSQRYQTLRQQLETMNRLSPSGSKAA